MQLHQLEHDRRGDVVREIARDAAGSEVLESKCEMSRVEKVAFDDGEVRDRFVDERGGEVAIDFEGGDRLRALGERAGEGAGAGADLDEVLIRPAARSP